MGSGDGHGPSMSMTEFNSLVVRGRGRHTQKMNEDARFSFPDRRHSSYSEVNPGVRVQCRLIFCPPSLPVLRSVPRSDPSSRHTRRRRSSAAGPGGILPTMASAAARRTIIRRPSHGVVQCLVILEKTNHPYVISGYSFYAFLPLVLCRQLVLELTDGWWLVEYN